MGSKADILGFAKRPDGGRSRQREQLEDNSSLVLIPDLEAICPQFVQCRFEVRVVWGTVERDFASFLARFGTVEGP